MRRCASIVVIVLILGFMVGTAAAQQMKEMKSPMPMRMEKKQPCAGKEMPMMKMGKVPNPDLVITTFEKQVVLPDEALAFEPTGMGEQFFAKLIAKVDFGNDVWFSIRKARIPK